jgi:tRNA threonylcarbamoyl adenosine modification protein (Sua5/YciO/YrdC/YwlC family)
VSAAKENSRTSGTIIRGDSPGAVSVAAAALGRGDVIAFPTDTVYGLAAAIDRPAAVERLFRLKGRSASKPIPVLLADQSQVDRIASAWPESASILAARFWPGALTLIVPARYGLARGVVGSDADGVATVAIRVPDHDLARELIEAAHGALAVTSANLAGSPPALNAHQAATLNLDSPVMVIDGGPAPGEVPSTVVSVVGSRFIVLRHGAIPALEIADALHAPVSGSLQ